MADPAGQISLKDISKESLADIASLSSQNRAPVTPHGITNNRHAETKDLHITTRERSSLTSVALCSARCVIYKSIVSIHFLVCHMLKVLAASNGRLHRQAGIKQLWSFNPKIETAML